jgi:ABC-type transporter Mla MlaB component
MLRVTSVIGRGSIPTLKVEGTLRGSWVAEVARACDDQLDSVGCLSLNLSAVTYVDESGLELLRRLLKRHVTLAACSALVAELLQLEER